MPYKGSALDKFLLVSLVAMGIFAGGSYLELRIARKEQRSLIEKNFERQQKESQIAGIITTTENRDNSSPDDVVIRVFNPNGKTLTEQVLYVRTNSQGKVMYSLNKSDKTEIPAEYPRR